MSGKSTSNIIVSIVAGVSLPAVLLLAQQQKSLWSILAFWEWIHHVDMGTILAALVAVSGYMVEHWISRQSQRLELQMERVKSQSADLLVPITIQMQSMVLGSLRQFVDCHIDDVDANKFIASEYGDANWGDNLLKRFSKLPSFDLPTDVQRPESFLFWLVDVLNDGNEDIAAMGNFTSAVTSATELPKFLHKAIEVCDNKPQSKLWISYEAFVRCELLPAIDKIAEIIDESGHLMERVPPKRLEELFQQEGTGLGQKWTYAPRMFFYSIWLAYARSWQSLLRKWDNGIYDDIRPTARFPIGLLFFNIEAQGIVSKVEKELVGMSQMHGSSNRGTMTTTTTEAKEETPIQNLLRFSSVNT